MSKYSTFLHCQHPIVCSIPHFHDIIFVGEFNTIVLRNGRMLNWHILHSNFPSARREKRSLFIRYATLSISDSTQPKKQTKRYIYEPLSTHLISPQPTKISMGKPFFQDRSQSPYVPHSTTVSIR